MSTHTGRSVPAQQYALQSWVKPYGPVLPADGAGSRLVRKSGRLSPLQALTVTRERLVWNRRADRWDEAGSVGLEKVVDEVLRQCRLCAPADPVAVDLGAGSGQVTLPLAEACSRVLAVDVSARSLDRLATKAAARGIANVERLTHPIETLDLSQASVDLIVSNYALHHLRDADKRRLLVRCHNWLRPGGHIVIGDMMFGRGADRSDRAIIATKAGGLLRRGPAGWWRLLKNAVRFGLRLGEKPLPPHRWESLARDAGFDQVTVRCILCEAHLLLATKPHTDIFER